MGGGTDNLASWMVAGNDGEHYGRRVLYRLKDDPVTRHIPVMILSATESDDTGLKYGALSHISKPIQESRLSAPAAGKEIVRLQEAATGEDERRRSEERQAEMHRHGLER